MIHSKGKFLLRLGVLAILLAPLTLQATPTVADQDASGWHIETVDSEGDVGEYTSLALDEEGYPHISYFDYTNRINPNLKYAYQDASGWHIETVDSEGQVGWYTSLALDESGYPHISYHSYYNPTGEYALKYAHQDASGWHIETVDSVGITGYYTSLALDESGYPHISYYDDTNDDLKYAYQDASGWHIETVDSAGYVGEYTSLTLDGSGYPHISYYCCGTPTPGCNIGDLKYAYQDASGWHIETVDSEGNVGRHTSLALDESGYPHISYYDDTNDDLKYAYQDASGWHIETVDGEWRVGASTSLVLDGNGFPHISYYFCGTPHYICNVGDLKYAYQNTSGWHIETVDRGDWDVGNFTSLSLDEGGYPHIGYYDNANGDLKYTYYSAWTLYLPLIRKETP